MTVFPKGKHDDQFDSAARFFDWFKKPFPTGGIYEYYRQLAQGAEQRCKPLPICGRPLRGKRKLRDCGGA